VEVRRQIRSLVLNRLEKLGPAWINGKPAGSWASMVLEQVENMQDFFARYLPQMYLAVFIPLIVLCVVFPVNWAAGVILLVTAPLIPFFMALVGMGAADANRRNFQALARLSGSFLDRLRGLETLRLFNRAQAEVNHIRHDAEDFRERTMEVLYMAFLSSAVLEFFTSISIAIVAVYFGFSYLGELNFGHYSQGVTLFAGFLVLILAPEFFQPLRDLGTFYHAKAQAIGAAETLVEFLSAEAQTPSQGNKPYQPHAQTQQHSTVPASETPHIWAQDLEILSPQGTVLAGPLNFQIFAGEHIALVGRSGAGKTSLMNVLLGFLPYRGSLQVNGQELRELDPQSWRAHLAWVGQNPRLLQGTIRDNILLGAPQASVEDVQHAVIAAHADEFIVRLPQGLETPVSDEGAGLSVGQAQRIAVARALLRQGEFLLLDEPTASLDARSEQWVMQALAQAAQTRTTFMITHRLEDVRNCHQIWLMDSGKLVQQGTFATLSQSDGPFAAMLANRNQEI
ncbi:MAG: heme ABC transporter permease/ATP-binding protein CydD, partial [Plesiomonas sp.]